MTRAVVALMLGVFGAGGALAQSPENDEGFYIGAGIGQFNVKIDDIDDTDEAVQEFIRSGTSSQGPSWIVPGAGEGAKALKAAYEASYPVVLLSARQGVGTDGFLSAAFESLDRVRVYTRTPGKKPDLTNPFVFRNGVTVIELARQIHKDFEKTYRAARIYSKDKYDGQRVGKDFVLRDGDVIELIV